MTGLPIQIITLMEVVPPAGWRGAPRKVAKKFGLLLVHLVLAWDILRMPRDRFGLVREFLSVPTLLIWPVIWFRRRRLLFVVNHNLDSALCSPLQRLALRWLWRMGIRLLCFESTAGLAELGLSNDSPRAFAIPTPLSPISSLRSSTGRQPPVIGIVGNVRSEKGFDDLLRVMTDAVRVGKLTARLLIGTGDAEVRRRCGALGWEEVDTTRQQDYFNALSRCDLVVFNYQRSNYFFRISGVVADAISAGAFVVAPNFPGLASQISEPSRVGLTFDSVEELPELLNRALNLAAATPADAFQLQVASRSPARLAECLREVFRSFEPIIAVSPARA